MIPRLSQLLRISIVVLVILGLSTLPAHAVIGKLIESNISDLIAGIMNFLIAGMGWILAMAGGLLNFSVELTLQIRNFVDSTPGIFATWRAIRDISGLFIIFFLLYAAIKMILGFDAKLKQLVINVVIAGVAINFSFFVASVGIDASNIVSMQIYNAIAPANSLSPNATAENFFGFGTNIEGQRSRFGDGGLSDIFMQHLKIQTIHNTKLAGSASAAGTTDVPAPMKIFLAGITAIMIELAAAISFAAAALAFVVRFVVLLLLLAFSPVWFAMQIIPKGSGLGEYADKWTKNYTGMLLFMPVYLMLMYLALNVLSTSALFTGNQLIGGGMTSYIALATNALIVIILINMPLVAAISVAGSATKFINTDKLGAARLWKGLGRQSYQGTVSRAASKVANAESFKNAASRSNFAALALKGTRATGAAYDAKLNKQVKERTEFADSLGYDKTKVRSAETNLQNMKNRQSTLRSTGDMAGAKALDSEIKEASDAISSIKTSRAKNYASNIDSRNIETLWMKVARKNKVAAAKIESVVINKQLEKAKKDLEKASEKIKETQKKIDDLNQQIKSGNARDEKQAKIAITDLEKTLPELYKKEGEQQAEVAKLSDRASRYDSIA